ncbi:hypothetical protein NL532_25805 [Mesorhizobium sp. C120A]|uniref:DUF6615 family protein n=1 Tax=unclassified Mesorhizobium TaxID=325217 RepID=UPI0003D01486|nr:MULTISPECIES: DUF6615 family protein [unclassified Mesorhizobium]ESZ60191.1 hypothetical protein X728_16780 [Mesorhizobium sp. L103C120A0]WJI44004.1 hypothetical protein NL532_25805 [Mesorhizobium sp. C120A]
MTPICQSFQQKADWVWRQIADADRHGLAFSEETITETILLDLQREHPEEVRLRAFTKREEKNNGADWEWWIGRPGRWLGMRIQAKRLALPREEFKQLQSYGRKNGSPPQIDVLIAEAAKHSLNPGYCLYIHSRKWPTLRAWPVYGFVGGGPLSPQGCLLASANAVKATGSNALTRIAPVAVPWHLMVCHCAAGVFNRGIADAAWAMLRASSELAGGDLGDGLFPPVEELPPHMRLLREAGESDGIAAELRHIAIGRGLRGFLLIQEERG